MKSLLLTLVLAATLVGCGGGGGSSNTEPSNKTPTQPPVVEKKFSINSNVLVSNKQIPTEHYCKAYNGMELSPQLSWSDYPKDTGGFVLFATETVTNKNGDLVDNIYLSTSMLPVTTNFISTGEDISKTISGASWGRNMSNDIGWVSPCGLPEEIGKRDLKFIVYAVKAEFKDIPFKLSVLTWSPTQMENKYKDYVLSKTTLVVKM